MRLEFNMNIKQAIFFTIEHWLAETRPDLLEDPETYYLCNQLKLAREKLERNIESIKLKGGER